MIAGQVVSLRAMVPITFRRPGQPNLTLDFMIDTGFSGALTLPPATVNDLGLPFLEDTSANLANDLTVALPVHVATIVWDGAERTVRALAVGRRPLLGTALLAGTHLGIDFVNGGDITIAALP